MNWPCLDQPNIIYHTSCIIFLPWSVPYSNTHSRSHFMSKPLTLLLALRLEYHYINVIMTTMASQITSLTVVYSTVYSDADQRKHQSSAPLAFVWGIHRGRWIPRTKGQLRGKCFHLMTSSCSWGKWSMFLLLISALAFCIGRSSTAIVLIMQHRSIVFHKKGFLQNCAKHFQC